MSNSKDCDPEISRFFKCFYSLGKGDFYSTCMEQMIASGLAERALVSVVNGDRVSVHRCDGLFLRFKYGELNFDQIKYKQLEVIDTVIHKDHDLRKNYENYINYEFIYGATYIDSPISDPNDGVLISLFRGLVRSENPSPPTQKLINGNFDLAISMDQPLYFYINICNLMLVSRFDFTVMQNLRVLTIPPSNFDKAREMQNELYIKLIESADKTRVSLKTFLFLATVHNHIEVVKYLIDVLHVDVDIEYDIELSHFLLLWGSGSFTDENGNCFSIDVDTRNDISITFCY
jgi:hypothetical protein